MTGDVTWNSGTFNGTGNVSAAGTLATVNANVGSFGSGTSVPNFTVNGKGLITAVSTNAIPTADNVGTSGLTTLASSADGIAGTSTTKALTPAASAAQMFESSPITITPNSAGTLAHGLGVKPKRIQAFIRNVNAEFGYSTGNEVPVNVYYEAAWRGAQGYIADTTYVGYTIATAIEILNASTGGGSLITNANWTLIIRAWAN
jgi:hypothetical protein